MTNREWLESLPSYQLAEWIDCPLYKFRGENNGQICPEEYRYKSMCRACTEAWLKEERT